MLEFVLVLAAVAVMLPVEAGTVLLCRAAAEASTFMLISAEVGSGIETAPAMPMECSWWPFVVGAVVDVETVSEGAGGWVVVWRWWWWDGEKASGTVSMPRNLPNSYSFSAVVLPVCVSGPLVVVVVASVLYKPVLVVVPVVRDAFVDGGVGDGQKRGVPERSEKAGVPGLFFPSLADPSTSAPTRQVQSPRELTSLTDHTDLH